MFSANGETSDVVGVASSQLIVLPIKPVVLGIYVALYGLICFIVSFHAYHEIESERINTYKKYYKNTENMIDAIWELEPEMFDKIDKSQYDTSRNKVYKLNHTNN